MLDTIRQWARRIKQDAVMLWFACRDPRTPWLPKIICMLAVAYALSPIDLIPDFIPVLGYLDDAILLPAMVWLAVKLLPAVVVSDCRAEAAEWMQHHERKPVSRWGVVFVLLVWSLALLLLAWWWF
ncbi:MAG: hypothetical protein RLZZ566_280 [Pseudomonadota bacterium]|jgi:uncharacterized membrane protein YkvA (DUF1232 family)